MHVSWASALLMNSIILLVGQAKPRTYRKKARKNYLLLAWSKRFGYHLIHSTPRAQLQFIRRNIRHIETLSVNCPLTEKQKAQPTTVQ